MAIREINAPSVRRTSTPRFKADEVKQAVKMLKEGKTPGVGPFEGEKAIREARSSAQSLLRACQEVAPDLDLGTRSWSDEKGEAFGIVRVK